MKKLIFAFFSLLTLVSCQEIPHQSMLVKDLARSAYQQPQQDQLSLTDMVYKFQIGLTAIYGEAFTNKAWH